MSETRVRGQSPPGQEGELIAKWIQGWMRLEDLGGGHAIVVITPRGERSTVADVYYGDDTEIKWNTDGMAAIEQYKRDWWDTKFYVAITEWLKERS